MRSWYKTVYTIKYSDKLRRINKNRDKKGLEHELLEIHGFIDNYLQNKNKCVVFVNYFHICLLLSWSHHFHFSLSSSHIKPQMDY